MGKTIVMVTHDAKMAMILLKDGVVLEELKKKDSGGEFYHRIIEKMDIL